MKLSFNWIKLQHREASITSKSLVVGVILQVALNPSKQIFLDLGRYQCSALWEKFLNQIIQVDLLQTLASNKIYSSLINQSLELTKAVLLKLILPSTLNKLLSQVFFKSLLFATLLKLLLNETLLESNISIVLGTIGDYQESLTSYFQI